MSATEEWLAVIGLGTVVGYAIALCLFAAKLIGVLS